MNYYRRYVGDYLKKTARLSMVEHGAYNLLLDYYYSDEKPLPLNRDELYTMVRAMTPIDRKATDKVLDRYFEARDDGYHNSRADHEIEVSKKARDNGNKGGRPRTEPVTGCGTETITEPVTGTITGDGGGSVHPPTTNHQPLAFIPHPKKKPLVASPPTQFDEAWEKYPKRSGNNPKADALRAWNARVKEGVATEAMLAGLKRYAVWCEETDKIGGETVMQAVRFFGKSRIFEQDFALPAPKSNGSGAPWWSSNEGIQAKAAELGVVSRGGESWNDLKARVNAALEAA